MLISGLNRTTLLDFPGHVAATVFTGGCNFRCPFCHNGELALNPLSQENYTEEEIFSFLEKRKGILKGVCITGGEPTMQNDLPEFIAGIKEIGYAVKLDTNGSFPEMLEKLLEEKMLDYVAMDIKNCREKYGLTAGMKEVNLKKIETSIRLLKESSIEYEFRTTVVKEFHSMEDILKIGKWIGGCPHYFLQQYQENENVIAHREDMALSSYDKAEMEEMLRALNELPEMSGKAVLRGVL